MEEIGNQLKELILDEDFTNLQNLASVMMELKNSLQNDSSLYWKMN